MRAEKSSFQDPASRVFYDDAGIGREVYPSYFTDYEKLISSGLYEELLNNRLIIPHNWENLPGKIILRPAEVPFISYPYEWCFSILKEAALKTLTINRIALNHGMMLKDASAYNMQWYQGRITLIDTCSFIEYKPGMPWGAYRQFLQHFICPLLLMKYRDTSFGKLSQVYLDGIPVRLAAKLLPQWLKFNPGLIAHVYSQSLNFTVSEKRNVTVSTLAFTALLDNLEKLIASLTYEPKGGWSKYTAGDSYTAKAKESKTLIISRNLPFDGTVLDLGCNTGEYVNINRENGFRLAADYDHACIEMLYKSTRLVLPLVIDLCNPSPAIGWENTERKSFWDRVKVDTIMVLALIHHLCVANNVPLSRVAELLAAHCDKLIIEWVPLDDPKAKQLLGKKNIPEYSLEIFIAEFSKHFNLRGEYPIDDSLRTIFVMEKR